ncbi:MAG: hypothetical protein VX798_15665 [Bacteroidota bacterium]|nr:hypothetical protein [Bacteroidota bacterium]
MYYSNKDIMEMDKVVRLKIINSITGETLRKITPYIIETYVPVHMNKPDSFLKEN